MFRPIQHHLSFLPLSTPPPTPYLPSPRTMSGHSKVSGLTTRLQHIPTDSKLTPKSISKDSQEKHKSPSQAKYTKTYQEDKLPLGRGQGRLGLQFTNPGTSQLRNDLLIAPMVTVRIASDLSTQTLGNHPTTPPNNLPLSSQR